MNTSENDKTQGIVSEITHDTTNSAPCHKFPMLKNGTALRWARYGAIRSNVYIDGNEYLFGPWCTSVPPSIGAAYRIVVKTKDGAR